MFKKLVPDASFAAFDADRCVIASAETVTIQPGQVGIVHTGLKTLNPLALSLSPVAEKLDMCALLTTALSPAQEVKVAILNRDSEPVTITPKEFFLISCRLVESEEFEG